MLTVKAMARTCLHLQSKLVRFWANQQCFCRRIIPTQTILKGKLSKMRMYNVYIYHITICRFSYQCSSERDQSKKYWNWFRILFPDRASFTFPISFRQYFSICNKQQMSPQNILDSINLEKSFLIHARATITYYNFSQLCQLSPSPPKSQLSLSQQSRHWKKGTFFAFNFTFVCFAERRHFIVGVCWGGRDAKAEVCKGHRPAPKPQDGIHKFRLPGKYRWLVQLSSTGKADLLLWHIYVYPHHVPPYREC